ncbi:MAG: fused MFS/spermidine synthase [Planctomycetaceae bacterium]|nr:fused MFS/spermidine synthase [Planctomycetaceae bacterium]
MPHAAAESNPTNQAEPSERGALPLLVGATTLLGAFLLFQIQPLIAQAILPWYGGTSAVWTTALLFFQVALVVGYGYVYLTTRFLGSASRAYLQIGLSVACLALLPILPSAEWKPAAGVEPTWSVFKLLAACVGAPFVLLATTGPLTQDFFHRATGGRSPYRLYALSNAGSLLGLLTFPFLVEPILDLTQRSHFWSWIFSVYVALLAFTAWKTRHATISANAARISANAKLKRSSDADAGPKKRMVASWLALAGCGTLLLMVTTSYLSQDLPSGPLVWLLPLTLYLLSFIICFDHPRWYRPGPTAIVALIAIPMASHPLSPTTNVVVPLAWNSVMLLAGCLLFHGELAKRKPSAHHLAGYFLCISVGGALGGAFVAVVAPRIYERYWEWFAVLLGTWLFSAAVLAATLTNRGLLQNRAVQAAGVVAVLAGAGYLINLDRSHFPADELLSGRNSFGVVTIQNLVDLNTGNVVGHTMRSGTTRHGLQVTAGGNSRNATTYYGVESGVGTALMRAREHGRPIRVGVVGLGVGTLATYGRERDVFRFYEINPLVIEFAQEYFTYLKESRAECEVVFGDARLVLENEEAQRYDLIVLDAFSSDAIPTHLLTAEAFDIYLRHLADDGIIAAHVSNRFLELGPVLSAAAGRFKLTGIQAFSADDPLHFAQGSRWIMLTRTPESRWWQSLKYPLATPLTKYPPTRLWTDAYTNLLPLLRFDDR